MEYFNFGLSVLFLIIFFGLYFKSCRLQKEETILKFKKRLICSEKDRLINELFNLEEERKSFEDKILTIEDMNMEKLHYNIIKSIKKDRYSWIELVNKIYKNLEENDIESLEKIIKNT